MIDNLMGNLLEQKFNTKEDIRAYLNKYNTAVNISEMLYKDYSNSVCNFKNLVLKCIGEIKKNIGNFTRALLCEVFISTCIRIERVEFNMYGEAIYDKKYSSDLVSILEERRGDSNIETIAETYVDNLCLNYENLSAVIKHEAKCFYLFKCEVIEAFMGELGCLSF